MNPDSGRPITVAPSPLRGEKERTSAGRGGIYIAAPNIARDCDSSDVDLNVGGLKARFTLTCSLCY